MKMLKAKCVIFNFFLQMELQTGNSKVHPHLPLVGQTVSPANWLIVSGWLGCSNKQCFYVVAYEVGLCKMYFNRKLTHHV